VALDEVDPSIATEIRYAGRDNFVGAPIDGYEAPRCLLSEPAARGLAAVQEELRGSGLGLLVYDCYRPRRAVEHFLRWSREPADPRAQAEYFPNVPKAELVARGYLAERSAHSRGSAVDATLVRRDSWGGWHPLDMGTPHDFFDPRSHTDSADVSPEARANRRRLRDVMQRHGFRNLPEEWWHYVLANEPYPGADLDVPVR